VPETDLPCREREPPAQRAGRRSYGRSLADPGLDAEPYFVPCPLHRFRIHKKADEIASEISLDIGFSLTADKACHETNRG
jgi:hypothetical protein